MKKSEAAGKTGLGYALLNNVPSLPGQWPALTGAGDAAIPKSRNRPDNYLHVTNINGMRQAVQINLVINWMECDDGEHLLIQLREPDGNNAHDSLTVSKPSYDEMAELMREFNNRSY